MKIAGISDNHLVWEKPAGRLDDIVKTEWEKMDFIYQYCVDHEIKYLLGAGDMFDIKRSWGLLSVATDFFMKWRLYVETCLVMGQHDTYFHSITEKSTIFGVLKSSNLIIQLNKNPLSIGSGEIYLYGASWGEPVPKVHTKGRVNILVIHAPILTKKLWKDQTEYIDARQFMADHPFDWILCGDVHQYFHFAETLYNRSICNSGPMLRLEASQLMINHSPGFFVFDTDTRRVDWIQIPHKPASEVLTREHLERKAYRKELLDKFVDSIEGDFKSVKFEDNFRKYLEQNEVRDGVKQILIETNPEMKDKI